VKHQFTDIDISPLGSAVIGDGVNFSLFFENVTAVELLLFADGDAEQPCKVTGLDSVTNKTVYYWQTHPY
jgi:isoamylase